ncbi:MAG: hypothetical protein HC817_12145 [Saprospiraceae bacterium]|nr:hypothetical protein [Saprospiraceae bacterium]
MSFIFIICLSFSLSNCSEKECCEPPTLEGKLNLVFRPIYDAKPLIINQVYDYKGKKVRFERFQILLTNTCSADGSTQSPTTCVGSNNVYLLNFTTLDDSTSARAGFKLQLTNLAEFEKSQISFSLGVSNTLNAKEPKDFTSNNPLSDGTNYWVDWKSYIFAKIEGKIDTAGNGRFDKPFTLHTGGNEALYNMSVNNQLNIDKMGSSTLNFEVDMNTILRDIDLLTVKPLHRESEKPTMLVLANAIGKSISAKN